MEQTIGQLLRQGVAAHKNGKLQDAERIYRAILLAHPVHPDANHNLGVIAVSVNRVDMALPLFKTALETNPEVEQFWLSYIDALLKEQRFETCKQIIEQATQQGVDAIKLNPFESQLLANGPKPNDVSVSPPQDLLKRLIEHYQNNRFVDAEKLSIKITQDFPDHSFAWKVLGGALRATGKKTEAVDANRKAVALSPRAADVHGNLGMTLQELGRFDEAETSFNQAIALNPGSASAHYTLGVLLHERRRFDEAEICYKQAIALEPNLARSHYNLGVMLQELGRFDEAETSYKQAITLEPNLAAAYYNLGVMNQEHRRINEALVYYAQALELEPDYPEAYGNFSIAIKYHRFNQPNPKLYTPLTQLITIKTYTRPKDVAASILSLLKHDIRIKDLLLERNIALNLNELTSIIGSLDKLPLLHHLMRVTPLPDLQFEQLFVAMRRLLLKNLSAIAESPELIYFLSTLSIHCFVNEYVYAETGEEIAQVEELQVQIGQTLAQLDQPELIKVLCLATYRPLHNYDWHQKLESIDNLEEVKKRLIEEPFIEKMLAQDITVLAEISDDVSLNVRAQYEENPYPRWEKLGFPIKAKSIASVCDESELQLRSENIKNVTAPNILIAGCGTGQHSIGTASRFSNCHVTAVDLSLASLAYAQRKSNELGFTNIDYLQADILHLHQMDREFDIIESAGVLHHMDDPMAGWKVLVDILKPGGLMKIGLYSDLARRHIVRAREEVASLRVGTSEADIRGFRQLLSESHDKNHQRLTNSIDFFSLSSLRDLIFHVQEHRFTLPQIRNCLDELGLEFWI